MTISITCACGKKLRASDETAGMRGKCPDCGRIFTIPEPLTHDSSQAEWETLCRQAAALRQNWKEPGHLEQAEKIFREVIAKYPYHWKAHYGLGSLLMFRCQQTPGRSNLVLEEDAMLHLRKAIELAPKQREPILELARWLAATNLMEAERLYQRAVKCKDEEQDPLFPVDWQADHHWNYAVLASEDGANAVALEAFCRAIETDLHYYTQVVAPSPPKSNACWKLALKKLGLAAPSPPAPTASKAPQKPQPPPSPKQAPSPSPKQAPAPQQPATQQPSTQQPSTQQAATQQPATEQPAAQQPATQQPATQQPSSTEQPASTEKTPTPPRKPPSEGDGH